MDSSPVEKERRAILGRPVSSLCVFFAPSEWFKHRGQQTKNFLRFAKKKIVTIGKMQIKGHAKGHSGFSRPEGIELTDIQTCSNLNADKIRTRSTR